MPDDIDHELILEVAMPYISPFISKAVNWTPLMNLNTKFTKYDYPKPAEEDVWQFTSFLVDPMHAQNYSRAKKSQPDLSLGSLDGVKLNPEYASIMASL